MANPPLSSLRRIVVGTDFSPAAAVALSRGGDLAAACGATLHVVHGFRWPPIVDAMMAPAAAGWSDQLAALEAGLAAAVQPLRERGLLVLTDVAVGPPAAVVLAAARRGAGLVVLGTRGHAGVRALLGSTTRRVLERAPCAVLVVHAGDGERALRPTRVLAATDFSPGATAALLEASHLLGVGASAAVTLLHVCASPGGAAVAVDGGPGPADRLADVRWRLAEAAAELRRAGLRVEPELREVQPTGQPAAAIVAAARELHAELLVLGTRGLTGLAHLLLGSTAEDVALRAGCPVLVVPARRPVAAEQRPPVVERVLAPV